MPLFAEDTASPHQPAGEAEDDGHPDEAKERAAPPGLVGREAPAGLNTGVQG